MKFNFDTQKGRAKIYVRVRNITQSFTDNDGHYLSFWKTDAALQADMPDDFFSWAWEELVAGGRLVRCADNRWRAAPMKQELFMGGKNKTKRQVERDFANRLTRSIEGGRTRLELDGGQAREDHPFAKAEREKKQRDLWKR